MISPLRMTLRQPRSRSAIVAASLSASPPIVPVACLGSRARLRGAGTGVARMLRACSIIRGVRQPTSDTNSSV